MLITLLVAQLRQYCPDFSGRVAGDQLPAEGRQVPDTVWWRRRLADGDITLKPAKAGKTQEASSCPSDSATSRPT